MAPNYITGQGARRLQAEIVDLRQKQRPRIVSEVAEAAAQGDRSENAEYIYGKKKLREIDRRLHYLIKRLDSAVIVEPAQRPGGERGRVFFGATVTVSTVGGSPGSSDEEGAQATYQIVGEDEIDLRAGRISYRSPLALALMKRSVGDVVTFRRPSGEVELEIVAIDYR